MSKAKSDQTQKSLLRIGAVTAGILLIPLVAMQFSSEWDWKLADFIIIGALLVGAGSVYEFVVRKISNPTRRLMFGALLLFALLAIYVELAVGLFGTFFAGS